jgi:hypothetical protein
MLHLCSNYAVVKIFLAEVGFWTFFVLIDCGKAFEVAYLFFLMNVWQMFFVFYIFTNLARLFF